MRRALNCWERRNPPSRPVNRGLLHGGSRPHANRYSPVFRVKICGVTNCGDAKKALDAGADAIGLNFYKQSKRYVPFKEALETASLLRDVIWTIGVFVDAEPSEILRIAERLHLSAVQLHGHEPPEVLAQLRGLRVIKAMRANRSQWNELMHYLERCGELDAMPYAVLLDAAVPNQLGGTGRPADWDLAGSYAETPGLPPLVLAGGLNPGNVAKAIEVVRPAAVDSASGVESEAGRLCASKAEAFVQAARRAFARLEALRNQT